MGILKPTHRELARGGKDNIKAGRHQPNLDHDARRRKLDRVLEPFDKLTALERTNGNPFNPGGGPSANGDGFPSDDDYATDYSNPFASSAPRRPPSRVSSRASSIASSFGSVDSGVSHPPRETGKKRKLKKVIDLSYTEFTQRANVKPREESAKISPKGEPYYRKDSLPQTISNSPGLNTTRSHICGTSKRSFSRREQFKWHENSHTQKPFEYPECTQWFARKGSLQHHRQKLHQYRLSDPPDIFESLLDEPEQPPPEDMSTGDLDWVPREQPLRFEGDIYTPKWIRGYADGSEGWCGLCKPGPWVLLRDSAYWYDKIFTHGISALEGLKGNTFQEPLGMRRMDEDLNVWEGLCRNCDGWIPLVRSTTDGWTWFRHAYKVSLIEPPFPLAHGEEERILRAGSATQSSRRKQSRQPRTIGTRKRSFPLCPNPKKKKRDFGQRCGSRL